MTDDCNSPGATAVSDPNYLESQSCDWVPDDEDEWCEASPAAYAGEYYYGCEEHFDALAEWIETPSPIVHLSDGPRLILADGSVVRLIVSTPDDGERPFTRYNQGSARHGWDDDNDAPVDIAHVDDPDAAEHDLVEKRREELGVADDN